MNNPHTQPMFKNADRFETGIEFKSSLHLLQLPIELQDQYFSIFDYCSLNNIKRIRNTKSEKLSSNYTRRIFAIDIRNLVNGVKEELVELTDKTGKNPTTSNILKLCEDKFFHLMLFNISRIKLLLCMTASDFYVAYKEKENKEKQIEFTTLTKNDVKKKLLLVKIANVTDGCGGYTTCRIPLYAVDALKMIIRQTKNNKIIPTNELVFALDRSIIYSHTKTLIITQARMFYRKPGRVITKNVKENIEFHAQRYNLGQINRELLSEFLKTDFLRNSFRLATYYNTQYYQPYDEIDEVAKVAEIMCLSEAGRLPG